MDELFAAYLAEGPGMHLSGTTQEAQERTYRLRVQPHLGRLPLRELTPEAWAEYTRYLIRYSSDSMAYAASSLVTKLCAYAVQLHLLYRNPCYATRYEPHRKPYLHHVLTENDLIAVMRAAANTPIESLYGLEVCCGLRPSELLALAENKVLDGGTRLVVDQHLVNYRTLGGFTVSHQSRNYGLSRTIELPSPAVHFIARQLEQVSLWRKRDGWRSPEGLIFDDPARKVLTMHFINCQNARIRQLTGLDEFSLQLVRESYGISCLKRGMSHKALQVYMGYLQIDQLIRAIDLRNVGYPVRF